MIQKIIALQRIRGIGANFSTVLVREVLCGNRAGGLHRLPYLPGDRHHRLSRSWRISGERAGHGRA